MIEITENTAWALFGRGSIALAGCQQINDDGRFYVALQSCFEGAVGHEDDVDRELPIENGWVPGSRGPCVLLEFERVEGLDQLLHQLLDHRKRKFPDAAPYELDERP